MEAHFSKSIQRAESCEAVLSLLLSEGLRVGLGTVAVGELPGEGTSKLKPFFYSTWPASWFEVYAEAGLVGSDPLVDAARGAPDAFLWTEMETDLGRWDLTKDDLKVTYLAREFGRKEGLNWREGFAVPIHGLDGYVGLVSWVGEPRKFDPLAQADLHLKSIIAHNRMHALHRAMHGATHNVADAYGLTRGELDVLAAMCRGQPDTEIAKALKIAERTVQHRVNQTKSKIGCRSRSQLAAAAAKLGLI